MSGRGWAATIVRFATPRARRRELALAALLAGATRLFAAATPVPGQLHTPLGATSPLANGDYVSAAPALNTYYSYFVEVPPGTGTLTVDIFDADIGNGTGGNLHDQAIGGFDTSVNYSVRTPLGVVVANPTFGPGACGACNGAWFQLYTTANPQPGHWEVRLNMSGAVTGGNDVNAFGIRAHDGNVGAGGTELNVYMFSFVELGALNGTTPAFPVRTYNLYTYVSSGCVVDSNDFDSDNGVTLSYATRTGTSVASFGLGAVSGNNAWANNVATGWTTDTSSIGYGLWRCTHIVSTPGGQAGNLMTLYQGSFSAANPPPTAQPQANTFRQYLPTDGGGIPVKPYVEQVLTFVNGPNPPVVGLTTRVTVTVRAANPTPFGITFSAANTVTANVPGAGAVYAGNALVSQGSILSQPAVGGTGNVVWNPGVVAAGQTALLSYAVDVTPTLAGQRVPVTGTPPANGTTARWVDETCTGAAPACAGLQLTTATFTFGPLCELALTEGLATPIQLTSFTLGAEASGVVVEWETASEIGTAGFYLYRYDRDQGEWIQLNDAILLALQTAPQGGRYRYSDDDARADETLTYALVEVDATGRSSVYGPYTLRADASSPLTEPAGRFVRRPRGPQPGTLRRLLQQRAQRQHLLDERQARRRETRFRRGQPVSALKMSIRESGLYHVAAEEIGNLLGVEPASIEDLISKGRISLTLRGREAAWLASEDGRGLFFYGESIDSPYTSENVYWLRLRPGLGMAHVPSRGGAGATGAESFSDRLTREEEVFAGTVVPTDPDSDFWYWSALSAGDSEYGTRSFTFDLPAALPVSAGDAHLSLRLQGASDTGARGEHHVVARVNGAWVGETRWEGRARQDASFAFPQQVLHPGENSLELTGLKDPSVPFSFVYVDGFGVEYRRFYVAEGGALSFSSENHRALSVDGFQEPTIRVLDISNRLRPRVLDGIEIERSESGYRASFGSRPRADLLAVSASAVRSPEAIWADTPSRLRSPRQRVDYVVVAPAELEAGARELAEYRGRQGLRSAVVLLEDVYDEFNDGIESPHALRELLRYADARWRRAPRYVVLAGKGSFDYKDTQRLGGNLIPPLMMRTPDGLYASDARFVDVDDDGAPDMSVGRLPVVTAEELDDYLTKLRAYESASIDGNSEDWTRRVLMVADASDRGADFSRDSDRVARLLPSSYRVETIYAQELGAVQARQLLTEAIAAGSGHVNYVGHGSLQMLSSLGLLTLTDVEELDNGARLPVVTTMTCSVGRFEVPGFESLAEALVSKADGGAAAVFGPTGLSRQSDAVRLNERFFQLGFQSEGEERLGDLVLRTLEAFAKEEGPAFMVGGYHLFGDPAMRLKRPPPLEMPPSSESLF